MDAREVERSLAAGEQALQALLTWVPERANTLEAHEAEQGLFTRLLPIGLAALQRSFAQRGTGERGPAITRADGATRPREKRLRGRDDLSRFGKCKGARPGSRTPGEPGSCPLEAQVHLPERCDSYVRQAGMTVFEGEPPCNERAGFWAPRVDLEVAERVVREVAPEAPQDDEAFSAPRPRSPQATAGAVLVVRVAGTGVPRLTAEAAKLQAQWGTGETRPPPQAALGGGRSTVAPKPRSPAARAARLVDPEAARARRHRAGATDDAPRAHPGRRVARWGRTTPAGRERIKADAARRDPQHRTPLVMRLDGALGRGRLAPPLVTPWPRVTCVLDILPVVGSRWRAANALCGDQSKVGQQWVPQQRTAILRGRVGYVLGGRRHIRTKQRRRPSVRETLAHVITFFHHHRRWMHYDA